MTNTRIGCFFSNLLIGLIFSGLVVFAINQSDQNFKIMFLNLVSIMTNIWEPIWVVGITTTSIWLRRNMHRGL